MYLLEGHLPLCPAQSGPWRTMGKEVSPRGQDKVSQRPMNKEDHSKSRSRDFWVFQSRNSSVDLSLEECITDYETMTALYFPFSSFL